MSTPTQPTHSAVQPARRRGCGRLAVLGLLLCWVWQLPCWVPTMLTQLAGGLSPGWLPWLAGLLLAAGWLLALAAFLSLARQRVWPSLIWLAQALIAAAGYALLAIGVRALTQSDRWFEAGLSLAGLTCFGLAAGVWLMTAHDLPRRHWVEVFGLRAPRPAGLLFGLGLAGLLTLGWPLAGALGDRLSSLALLVQVLAVVLPEELMFRGVLLGFLTERFTTRPASAARLSWLVYLTILPGQVLPFGDWDALVGLPLLAALALVTNRLRILTGSVWPGLLLVWLTRAMPQLFTDARDEIPEPAQVLAWGGTVGGAMLLAFLMWLVWRLSRGRLPALGVRLVLSGFLVAAVWTGWLVAWHWAGVPGFHDDGFIIMMQQQADLSAAESITDPVARRAYVYHTLVDTAEQSQAPIREKLAAAGLPFRAYYLQNMIRVEGYHWRQSEFAALPGVAAVIPNPNVRPYPTHVALGIWSEQRAAEPAGEGVEWNVRDIGADAVWAMGFEGQGIVVGSQDSGFDWQHPALRNAYRGWDALSGQVDHDYNWHDAWDDRPAPFDEDGHGTHTLGTAVGNGGANRRIGVAPGARWMGCRNMRRGIGNPASYVECMEFLLAPYPIGGDPFHDGDVTRSPDVINNSWGCPDREGCQDDTLNGAIEALRAAGIMMVTSAGNDGPACGTANEPPARYAAVFTVGATDQAGLITPFSSRGPVPDPNRAPYLLKPDLVAPGQDIRSALPGGGYGTASGTSAAGPHVTGAVALLWSARPELRGNLAATEDLLRRSATPVEVGGSCPSPTADWVGSGSLSRLLRTLQTTPIVCACGNVAGVPNNVYGWGRLNVLRAIEMAGQAK